jgi:glutaminyl-peptide cyclotransferase
VDKATGKVIRSLPLPDQWFGEGIVQLNGRIYQLTWRSGVCRVVNRNTFQVEKMIRYPGEGWGLTTDGTHLFMSDGTHELRVLAPDTFDEIRRIPVMEGERPVRDLNELEWIDGEIWANLWKTGRVVRIDPATGKVIGGINLSHLPLPEDRWRGQDVLNGIAVDPETGEIWVTGKKWKALYRIEWPVGQEKD